MISAASNDPWCFWALHLQLGFNVCDCDGNPHLTKTETYLPRSVSSSELLKEEQMAFTVRKAKLYLIIQAFQQERIQKTR